ncbi:UTRA domain-containing protein [Jiangella aurantiaca]|uniref:UTRA domain-containing protein n=1 Tax=Jiangella aurantiaca TaxID=2530373 RepID=UPI0013A5E47B|nr:UTRA domain-containing protein [Jiangella aurantiaca]
MIESGQIDRSSPIPLYHQLEYLLRGEIESGRYRPGDTLPSEGDICARYEVSRSVVRQTLTNLTHAGLIRTERGRGSFVAEKKLQERFVQRTTGLYDDLRQMGYEIRTHVVRQSVGELPLPVQDFLQAKRGVQIDRVRSVDGRVLTFIRSLIPESRCPGLETADLEDRSLYQVLADEYGLRVASGRRTVEAVAAEGEIAKHLGVDVGEPLLLLRSSSRDERGEPLEWFEAWHRGDRTMFEIEITPGEADQPFSSVVRLGYGAGEGPAGSATAGADSAPAPPAEGIDTLVEAMRRSRVVAVWRASRYREPAVVARLLAEAGVTVVEVTLTGENALAALAEARTVDGVVVGAGTVMTAADARDAIAAGAQFLVAPVGAEEVVAAARPSSTPVILAGFTPTEVWAAWQATGAPVKVFPASVGGPEYLPILHGPMPDVPLLPAGGVDIDTAVEYLRAGAVAVNVGGPLCPPDALVDGEIDVIGERVKQLRRALADL